MPANYSGGLVVRIANGETDSEPIGFGSWAQGGFILPATFTGTATTFKVSCDGVNYFLFPLASSFAVAQGQAYAFPIGLFPFPWVKIVSNAAEGGERQIIVALKY